MQVHEELGPHLHGGRNGTSSSGGAAGGAPAHLPSQPAVKQQQQQQHAGLGNNPLGATMGGGMGGMFVVPTSGAPGSMSMGMGMGFSTPANNSASQHSLTLSDGAPPSHLHTAFAAQSGLLSSTLASPNNSGAHALFQSPSQGQGFQGFSRTSHQGAGAHGGGAYVTHPGSAAGLVTHNNIVMSHAGMERMERMGGAPMYHIPLGHTSSMGGSTAPPGNATTTHNNNSLYREGSQGSGTVSTPAPPPTWALGTRAVSSTAGGGSSTATSAVPGPGQLRRDAAEQSVTASGGRSVTPGRATAVSLKGSESLGGVGSRGTSFSAKLASSAGNLLSRLVSADGRSLSVTSAGTVGGGPGGSLLSPMASPPSMSARNPLRLMQVRGSAVRVRLLQSRMSKGRPEAASLCVCRVRCSCNIVGTTGVTRGDKSPCMSLWMCFGMWIPRCCSSLCCSAHVNVCLLTVAYVLEMIMLCAWPS
jgi:hypothetical protein